MRSTKSIIRVTCGGSGASYPLKSMPWCHVYTKVMIHFIPNWYTKPINMGEVLLSIYSYWIVVFPKKKGYAKRSSNTSDVVHPKSKPKL